MQTRAYILDEPETAPLTTLIFFGVSIILHALLFGIIAYGPKIISSNKSYSSRPKSINVKLVSLPGNARKATRPARTKTRTKKTPPVKKKKPDLVLNKKTVKEKKVSLNPVKKTKIKKKSSKKHETYSTTSVVRKAVKDIERKTKSDRAKPVTDAIEELKRKMAESNPINDIQTTVDEQEAGGGGGGEVLLEALAMYQAEIYVQMRKNWAYPASLSKGRDIQVVVTIKILPTGKIADHWFVKRSGEKNLDSSAVNVVLKSDPLPPLPRSYKKPFYLLQLRFSQEGLR